MPGLTITVDDSSPIFTWSPLSSWFVATGQVDLAISSFYQSTATFTNASDASMSFEFFGNSIKIYGSKRENHGMFQVQVDDKTHDPINGNLPPPGSFQQELFSTHGLEDKLHTVLVKNLEDGKYVDVDFVTWQSELSDEDESAMVGTAQDTTPAIQYDGSWNTNPSNLGTFLGGTGHVSTQPGSSMQYVFTGSAIAIYGPSDPNGAPYTVQIDDEAPQNFSFHSVQYIPQSLLYFHGGLKTGKRTVKVTHKGADSGGNPLAIDYMNIFTTPTIEAVSDDGLPTTTIAAIAVGTVSGLVLFLITFYYCTRREKTWDSESKLSRVLSLGWWKYGADDKLEGASRVRGRRRDDTEDFELDGGGQYTAVKTSDKENGYLIPDFGPPGAVGSNTTRSRGSSFGSGGDAAEMGPLGLHQDTSRTRSNSTGTSGLHMKQESSLSGISVLNQPLLKPRSSTDVGPSGGAVRQLSPLPRSTVSVTPTPSNTAFFSANSQFRPTSTSPRPNAGIHPRPGDTRQTALSYHPQSASEPYSSTQAPSYQPEIQRKPTVVLPLPPGAARPRPQATELGELRSGGTAPVGSGGGNGGGGVSVGRAGSAGRGGSRVGGPRVRGSVSSGNWRMSGMEKNVDVVPPDYRPGPGWDMGGSGLAKR